METSKVESVVRYLAEAKLNQLEHSEPAGAIKTSRNAKSADDKKRKSWISEDDVSRISRWISNDDISSDVSIISSWIKT
ncbi:hypothetical protein F511_44930 [Dorcoceras hygrometricum]|uniref:Uncharacterized protein n=1 Tax=Dorcoceras hygrometricum TaxID=472368 RepID=A0A2Z7AB11_9LAMI|nr:hypothetical protein F511_44930 [Dorcoceras hygrometricum]